MEQTQRAELLWFHIRPTIIVKTPFKAHTRTQIFHLEVNEKHRVLAKFILENEGKIHAWLVEHFHYSRSLTVYFRQFWLIFQLKSLVTAVLLFCDLFLPFFFLSQQNFSVHLPHERMKLCIKEYLIRWSNPPSEQRKRRGTSGRVQSLLDATSSEQRKHGGTSPFPRDP